MHMFSDGLPFVWYEELAGREEFFKELLQQRSKLEGYGCNYSAQPDSEELSTAVWTREGSPTYIAVANPSNQIVKSNIRIMVQAVNPEAVIGRLEKLKAGNGNISVEIAAGGYAFVRIN